MAIPGSTRPSFRQYGYEHTRATIPIADALPVALLWRVVVFGLLIALRKDFVILMQLGRQHCHSTSNGNHHTLDDAVHAHRTQVDLGNLTKVTAQTSDANTPPQKTVPMQGVIHERGSIDLIQWSKLRVAIYMTTHVSEEHVAFLAQCWPEATKKLKLFHESDLILYTSKKISENILNKLHFRKIVVKTYTQLPIPDSAPFYERRSRKQQGAKQAMTDPFRHGWFDNYTWVVRLNPDVLVRQEKWLCQAMLNTTLDALLVRKGRNLYHSDFYAFRPKAVDPMVIYQSFDTADTAEAHLYASLKHVEDSGRAAWIPGSHPRGKLARTVGLSSPVVHEHAMLRHCPNYWDASDGRHYL